MANKPNIPELIKRYEENINSIYRHIDVCLNLWDQRKTITAVNDKYDLSLEAMDTSNLRHIYESSLVSAVVAWQSFASDWIVAAIAHDPSMLNQKLTASNSVSAKVGSLTLNVQPASIGKRLSTEKVRSLLERPSNNNYLAVNYKSDWQKYQNVLSPHYVDLVNRMTAEDFALLDLCTLIRNQSAHGSAESKKRLGRHLSGDPLKKLEAVDGVSLSKPHGINDLGYYLAAEMENPFGPGRQNTRLAYLLGKLRRLPKERLL